MNERLEPPLVTEALLMALECRRPDVDLQHSDRGSQYTSDAYRQALQRLGAVQSMSRNGNGWDNSVEESFFATLKVKLQLDRTRGSCPQTRTEIFVGIEVFYNRQRRHLSLGYRSQVAFEDQASIPD